MNSINLLIKLYKPNKVLINKTATILYCSNGNYVIKNKGSNSINELYKYLDSRDFNYYPKIIEDNRDEVNVYEYVNDFSIDNEQKLMDLMILISLLHNKTCYYKEVSNDKIKEIYENLLGRVLYIEENLNKIISEIEDNIFISPSGMLLVNNSSKIFESLTFAKNEIENWYKIALDKNKMRVCIVHNNLELDHYIKGDKDYLISWDKYIIDTPIIDIVKLYKKEYIKLNFLEPLKKYMEKFPLNEEEKKLLIIMLVIPDEISLNKNEIENVKIVREYLDYVFKTEDIIKNINKEMS